MELGLAVPMTRAEGSSGRRDINHTNQTKDAGESVADLKNGSTSDARSFFWVLE
jgi:hypothetical protein